MKIKMFYLIPYHIILEILHSWVVMEYNCFDKIFRKKFSIFQFFGYFKFDFSRKRFFLFKNWKIDPIFISRNKFPILKMFKYFPLNYVNINNYEFQHSLRIVESKEEIIQNKWEDGGVLGSTTVPYNRYCYYNHKYCFPRIYKFLDSTWKSAYIKTGPSFIKEFLENCKSLRVLEINLNIRTFYILNYLPRNLEVLVLIFDNKELFDSFNSTGIILDLTKISKRIINQQKNLKRFIIEVSKIFKLALQIPKNFNFKIVENMEIIQNKV